MSLRRGFKLTPVAALAGSLAAASAWSIKQLPANVRLSPSAAAGIAPNSPLGTVILKGFNMPATGATRPLGGASSFGAGTFFIQVLSDNKFQIWMRDSGGNEICRATSVGSVTGAAKTIAASFNAAALNLATGVQLYVDGVDVLDAGSSFTTRTDIGWNNADTHNLLGAHSGSDYAGAMEWQGIAMYAGLRADLADPNFWTTVADADAFGYDGSGIGAAASLLVTGSVDQINAGAVQFGTTGITYSNSGSGGAQVAVGPQTSWGP